MLLVEEECVDLCKKMLFDEMKLNMKDAITYKMFIVMLHVKEI